MNLSRVSAPLHNWGGGATPPLFWVLNLCGTQIKISNFNSNQRNLNLNILLIYLRGQGEKREGEKH